jgi:hypothetical protein
MNANIVAGKLRNSTQRRISAIEILKDWLRIRRER